MNTEQERADFEAWYMREFEVYPRRNESGGFRSQYVNAMFKSWKGGRAALQSQDREGWKEAAIAWEVCASIHREYCKGKDPLFKTRQADFAKHAEDARTRVLETEALHSQDREDAVRYRWLRDYSGFLTLPYVDHGAGPEFPSGIELDEAIDHARRVEGEANG